MTIHIYSNSLDRETEQTYGIAIDEMKTSQQIVKRVIIDVPADDWRECLPSCFNCCLPEPKAIRVKNEMAIDGWTYSPEYVSCSLSGYRSLVFWKYEFLNCAGVKQTD
jgi:hypothetical protein